MTHKEVMLRRRDLVDEVGNLNHVVKEINMSYLNGGDFINVRKQEIWSDNRLL